MSVYLKIKALPGNKLKKRFDYLSDKPKVKSFKRVLTIKCYTVLPGKFHRIALDDYKENLCDFTDFQ